MDGPDLDPLKVTPALPELEALLRARREASAAAERRRGGPLGRLRRRLERGAVRLDRLWAAQELRLLDGVSRRLGLERVVRAVPAFRGVFELPLSSDVTRYLLIGRFERQLSPLVEAALGEGDVIDVGAHAGLYTVLAAKLLGRRGRVLAIEPTPAALALLRGNLARNGLRDVLLYEGAVAEAPGRRTLHLLGGKEEYASLGGQHHPVALRGRPAAPAQGKEAAPAQALGLAELEVDVETLDRLVARHGLTPRFLKIDTEGAEGLVLRGAEEVLRRHRPVILSELDDRLLQPLGWSAEQVLRLLRDAGYRVHDAYRGVALSAAPAPFIGEVVAVPAA